MRTFKFILFCALAFCAACSTDTAVQRRGKDIYPGFAALKAANTEGLDYSREIYDRGSRISILAIHGGDIETTTARIARHVAGKDLNLYLFNGWHGRDNLDLHLTATNFDDPDAMRLASASALAVSIHAEAGRGEIVCVGGKNTTAAALIAKSLEAAGFAAEFPCARLPGTSVKNIVNLPPAGGVQLEINAHLLRRLEADEEELSRFSEAVRLAALEALPNIK